MVFQDFLMYLKTKQFKKKKPKTKKIIKWVHLR